MRLAVDAMGGDHAPEPIIRGAIQALLIHVAQRDDILAGDSREVISSPSSDTHKSDVQLFVRGDFAARCCVNIGG